MELTEFLLARIAEDEAVARRAADEFDINDPFPAAHVTYAPARVLAECEAKRRIVEIMLDQIDLGRRAGRWLNWEDMAMQTLRALALPYRDHPDFDRAWAD